MVPSNLCNSDSLLLHFTLRLLIKNCGNRMQNSLIFALSSSRHFHMGAVTGTRMSWELRLQSNEIVGSLNNLLFHSWGLVTDPMMRAAQEPRQKEASDFLV